MKKQKLRFTRLQFWLALSTLLLNCGNEVDDNSLLVPRGATLSVKTLASISTQTHRKGDSFSVILDAPLSRDTTIYAPMESQVDGVVAETQNVEGHGAPAYISVCLKKLYLPSGASVDLETNAITRVAKPMSRESTVGMATGFDETIAELTGKSTEQAGKESEIPETGFDTLIRNQAVIPADSSLVFTLDSDLIVPAPQ